MSKKVTQERPVGLVDGPMIEACSVQKIYDAGKVRVHTLKGVDLAIWRGEMVAVTGPSGCGKTTLLNTLSSLDYVGGGEVLIAGEPMGGMSDRRRTRFRAERMGFIFQSYLPRVEGAGAAYLEMEHAERC